MLRPSSIERSLHRLQQWMALRALAPNTVLAYRRYARRFLVHVDQPLATVTRQDIEAYVHTLIAKGRSPRTRNVQLGAIRALLVATGHRDRTAAIPRAKVPRLVLELLSGTEVQQLLAATTSPKYRALFMLAYGAGLRIGALPALETTDIDSQRMLIHVRHGKTGPRYVMVSPRVLRACANTGKPIGHRTAHSSLAMPARVRGRVSRAPRFIACSGSRHARRASRNASPRIRSGIVVRPTCSKAGPMCAACSSCWAMRRSQARRCICT